jgi:hypothetical protein
MSGYGLNNRGLISSKGREYSLRHYAQNASGPNSSKYPRIPPASLKHIFPKLFNIIVAFKLGL